MMDGTERDNSRYMLNYGGNEGYGSTRIKISGRSLPQSQSQLIAESYVDEDDEVEEDQEEGDTGLVQQHGDYVDNDDADDTDNNNDDDDDDDGDDGGGVDYRRSDGFNIHRHPKKRKLKSLSSSFELAPRVTLPPLPLAAPTPTPTSLAVKPGRRNTLTDWTERETFVLLDAWGERFLQRGRKSLRSEEWQEVAEKVSQGSKLERTDTQCRNRLDTLKKKYKKEKALLEQNKGANTKWVYFKKMNMLMVATPPPQQAGLLCGVNSGEFVFTNPNVYLNRANGLDEVRDSPGNAHSQDGDDDDDNDDLDLLPPKKSKHIGEKVNGGSFKLLADSINRFSEIYLKIENGKRKQMLELEKMRMDFYKDLELQKQKILERARDEIAKLRQGDHEENDDSAENIRG